jgi:GNAT superfamily N-acetyltransferase
MKIGLDYATTVELEGGLSVSLRPVRPSDRATLRREFLRLSPESRYRRFFAHISDLSDEMLTYMTEVDGIDHFALVATVDSPDLKTERGVGVARFVRTREDPAAAEAAVIVVDDMQHRGIGRLLVLTLITAARERGVQCFTGEVLASNAPMLAALRESGARLEPAGEGTLRFNVSIALEHEPILLRLFREVARSMAVFLLGLRPAPANPRSS